MVPGRISCWALFPVTLSGHQKLCDHGLLRRFSEETCGDPAQQFTRSGKKLRPAKEVRRRTGLAGRTDLCIGSREISRERVRVRALRRIKHFFFVYF